jgi:sporulation protein YlmC with PRC-barrel domain
MKKEHLLFALAFALSIFLTLPATTVAQMQEGTTLGGPSARYFFVDTLIGKEIISSDRAKVGEVENVVLSLDGRIFIEASRGGFLDIGETYTLIPWRDISNVTPNSVELTLSASEVQNAPSWSSETLGPGWEGQINSYFGAEQARPQGPQGSQLQRQYYGEEPTQQLAPGAAPGPMQYDLDSERPWWR